MKLDFLMCGSPNDSFFSQIAFFRRCLNALGGDYANARLVATFGDHTEEKIPSRWQPYYRDIEVVWSHLIGADNPAHQAQHYARYDHIRPDADMAVICDADVALLKPFPELIHSCLESPALYAVIANYSFNWPVVDGVSRKTNAIVDWPELSNWVLGREIEFNYNFTLNYPDSEERAPFYINYGFLAGPPEMLVELGRTERSLLAKVSKKVGPYWAPQVSIPFAVELKKIPCKPLPFRYNFGNDQVADELHANELEHLTVIHYYRNNIFEREKLFAEREYFQHFLELELTGSNQIFQKRVAEITGGVYPFE